MSEGKKELERQAKVTLRAAIENWMGRRHWLWLVLIVALSGGYVELPNLPLVGDDWFVSFLGLSAGFELVRRANEGRLELWASLTDAYGRVRQAAGGLLERARGRST